MTSFCSNYLPEHSYRYSIDEDLTTISRDSCVHAPRYIFKCKELRDDAGAAFAEADRRVAVAPAVRPEDHLVAVREVGAGLAGMQCGRAGSGLAQFAGAAIPFRAGSRDRAAAEQVARQQVAAAASGVRAPLRHGPVEVGR